MYGDRTKKPVQKAPAGKMSPGLKALLRDTGGLTADPSIRARIEEETTVLAEEDQRFIDKLIFWVDDKPYQGTIVDPGKEEKRIREADALGEPITRGDTERVRRKRPKKGLLEF